MLRSTLTELYTRDLEKLKAEIESYETEAGLWKKDDNMPNSAGNLALHLVGNLKHFIGAILGESGYVRHRELEFSTPSVPRAELLTAIDETTAVVSSTLGNLSDEDLSKDYPVEVFAGRETMRTDFFLTHLTTHLAYHLGQINYHRRLFGS